MKIFFIECNAEELKANRGLMDGIADAFENVFNAVYGTYASSAANRENDEEESEGEE